MSKKKAGAYMTVEAAMVLPIALGVIVFVIYLLFFQYDRCLLEQNTGILALRACSMQIKDNEERLRLLMEEAEQKDERYLAWVIEDAVMKFRGNQIRVERSGMLRCPFPGLLGLENKDWRSSIVYENYRIEPVEFIRNCRKIIMEEE